MPAKYYTQKFELKARAPVHHGRFFISFLRPFDCMYISIGLKHRTKISRKTNLKDINVIITVNGTSFSVTKQEQDFPFNHSFRPGTEVNYSVSNYNKKECFNAMIVFRGYEK